MYINKYINFLNSTIQQMLSSIAPISPGSRQKWNYTQYSGFPPGAISAKPCRSHVQTTKQVFLPGAPEELVSSGLCVSRPSSDLTSK